MKNLKKLLAILISAMLVLTLAACSSDEDDNNSDDGSAANPGNSSAPANTGETPNTQPPANNNFDLNREIHLLTRDSVSGTRSALVYLAKITDDGTSGGNDAITSEADVVGGTSAMIEQVQGNEVAIGYVSFGSIQGNNRVRAVAIDGVAATSANIENGTYELARNFNLTNNGNMNAAATDFWNFLFSAEGQAVVTRENYVQLSDNADAPAFESNGATGRITVGGSTSVSPLMDNLVAAYASAGGAVTVVVNPSGSSAGENNVTAGTYQIGMVSRDVANASLTQRTLAIDGIAVIVNPANPTTNIDLEDLRAIFMGEFLVWNEV
jgi:phosphate transport system substrate-binding protein